MLQKNRADKKAVEKSLKQVNFLTSFSLTFKFILNNNSVPQISLLRPKVSLAGGKEIYKKTGYAVWEKYSEISSGCGRFVFRKYQDDISIIENEIKIFSIKLISFTKIFISRNKCVFFPSCSEYEKQ